MRARLCGLAAVLIAYALPAWCDCSKDFVLPGVVQFKDEIGARPLNIVVGKVHLVDVRGATAEEQQQIVNSLVGFCFRSDYEGEVAERVRDGFQRRGFFTAQVVDLQMEPLDRSADPPTVSVIARIQEGARYRLREIKFKGNKAISDTPLLREQIPMQDGGIFDIGQVRDGLKNLRDLYGEFGYINFTPVPDAQLDEQKKLISLTVELDEGPQFVVKSFAISGVDRQREAALRAAWPLYLRPGRIYNKKLVDSFFTKTRDLLPPGATPAQNVMVKQDSREHTVDIILVLGSE